MSISNDLSSPDAFIFDADFYIELLKVGWFPGRQPLTIELAPHLDSFPPEVRRFICEFLWITFSKTKHFFYPNSNLEPPTQIRRHGVILL